MSDLDYKPNIYDMIWTMQRLLAGLRFGAHCSLQAALTSEVQKALDKC